MRSLFLVPLFLVLALNAFGHAGEIHTYMGTVTTLHDDGAFMLKKTDGETIHVLVATTTTYRYANGKAATRADLTAGKRAVVTISKDGKTASLIKIAMK